MTIALRTVGSLGSLAPLARSLAPLQPQPTSARADAFVTAGPAVPAQTLSRGAHGPAVKQLQDDLVRLKFLSRHDEATGPGKFGPHTEAALKAFQKHVHLSASGVYDSRTRHALQLALAPHPGVKPPVHKPAPKPVSHGVPKGEAAQYAYFAKQIGKHFKTGPNQMNLIGFRQQTSTYANGGRGKYDDKLVMLWKDAHGHPHVRQYTYNTEPAQVFASTARDVNGDGRGDLGRIPAGFHQFALSTRSGTGAHCLRTAQGDFQVERDVNHDGRFTEHRLSGGGANFLFHEGGVGQTWSQGCQTLPPAQWNRFWADVRHAHGTIGYTLVNGIPHGL